ncbi:hypothetical protein AB0A73_22150 [Glycomyces sp. NPDC047369]
MNHDDLTAALRRWAASAPESLYEGSRWTIACWQDAEGRLTVSGLLVATWGLVDFEEDPTIRARPNAPIPAWWLETALDLESITNLLASAGPGGPDLLAGVGIAAAPGPREDAIVHAWLAVADAAIRVELHRHGTWIGRCAIGDPLWWDQRALFEPLERFRARATGWPPNLPANLTAPTTNPRTSAAAWTGPC